MISELMKENIININEKNSRGRIFDSQNKVILSGTACAEFEFEYVQRSTFISFYSTKIRCQQASGRIDIIPIMISYQLKEELKEKSIKGKYIELTGRVRSHRKLKEGGDTKLDIYVLVSSIEVFDKKTQNADVNILYLEGIVCQEAKLWKESRKIDFSILVYRKRKSQEMDFFPCVAKGHLTYYEHELVPSKNVKIVGLFQSREYPNKHDDTRREKKMAYEIRAKKIEI